MNYKEDLIVNDHCFFGTIIIHKIGVREPSIFPYIPRQLLWYILYSMIERETPPFSFLYSIGAHLYAKNMVPLPQCQHNAHCNVHG